MSYRGDKDPAVEYRVLVRDKVAQCFQVAFRDTIREDE
jgi:hypothetical protein